MGGHVHRFIAHEERLHHESQEADSGEYPCGDPQSPDSVGAVLEHGRQDEDRSYAQAE